MRLNPMIFFLSKRNLLQNRKKPEHIFLQGFRKNNDLRIKIATMKGQHFEREKQFPNLNEIFFKLILLFIC